MPPAPGASTAQVLKGDEDPVPGRTVFPFTFAKQFAMIFRLPAAGCSAAGLAPQVPSFFPFYGLKMRSAKRLHLFTSFVALLLLAGFNFSASAETQAALPLDEHQRQCEEIAKDSLRRLQYAIKKDGFYSARVALNIWRSTALDAGNFDLAQYEAFKTQIYEISMRDNLRWFNLFVEQKNFEEARVCLELWRMHAREIGTFDLQEYDALKARLK
jgi:hypothetical protein